MKKLLIIIGVTIGLNTALADWPKKLWEIDLGIDFGTGIDWEPNKADINRLRQGEDKSVLFVVEFPVDPEFVRRVYWVSNTGEPKLIDDVLPEDTGLGMKKIIYFDSQHFIYMDDNNDGAERELSKITKLTRHKNDIEMTNFSADFVSRYGEMGVGAWDEMGNDFLGISRFQTVQVTTAGTKITAWDFAPPTEDTGNEGGNGGGNETANSRLIIKTAGPDISLATDGALGAAELQKSNDLRSWRRLGDVPAEASEVLVTPRESGNEFYRLKKK